MSLKVSIGQGTRGVIVEKDRKKEKKVGLCSTLLYHIIPYLPFSPCYFNMNCSREKKYEVQEDVLHKGMPRLMSRSGGVGPRET